MNYTFIVLAGMITIFFVAEYIGKIINPDSSMSVGIIAAGLELVLGSFPSILDEIFGLLSFTLTGKPLDNDVNKRVLYVKASEFIEDYSKMCGGTFDTDAFNEKYRNLDVLLIDDIQTLELGKKSQLEFFKIFDILY